MWISGGDHELSENIVHMVLAKIPGGPPGVKGISLFVVPRFLVGEDAGLGTHGAGEAGQDLRVDLVGLGELARGLCEVPGLAGVDHRDRDPSGASGDGGDDGAFVAAGASQD